MKISSGISSMKNFNISTSQIKGGRDYQEDYFETKIIDDNTSLLILADGMGGYKGGGLASKTIVQSFKNAFDTKNKDIKEALNRALLVSNEALAEEKIKNPEFHSMGTTLIVLYINVNFIQWLSVGDSPLWLMKKNKNYKIERINQNHSIAGLLELQYRNKEITKEEMENSPNKHMITSAIMGERISSIDLSDKISIKSEDILILASDGVESLTTKEIENTIVHSKSVNTQADEILKKINSKNISHQDNATILIISTLSKKNNTLWYFLGNNAICNKLYCFYSKLIKKEKKC